MHRDGTCSIAWPHSSLHLPASAHWRKTRQFRKLAHARQHSLLHQLLSSISTSQDPIDLITIGLQFPRVELQHRPALRKLGVEPEKTRTRLAIVDALRTARHPPFTADDHAAAAAAAAAAKPEPDPSRPRQSLVPHPSARSRSRPAAHPRSLWRCHARP